MRHYLITGTFTLTLLAIVGVVLVQGDEAKKDSWEDQLLEIAKNYEQWGRVDDQGRWAPFLCKRPNPAVARFSESDDEESHGQKLYSLFAKRRGAYVALTRYKKKNESNAAKTPEDYPSFEANAPAEDAQAGQIIVKESWTAKPVENLKLDADGQPPKVHRGEHDRFSPYAKRDGKWFKAAEKSALFIMFRVDLKTPGTDDGWVYGTVSADGKKVTSAGLVKSCMKCHEEAPHGRLFGLTQ